MILIYCDNIILTNTLNSRGFLKINEWKKQLIDDALPRIYDLINPTPESEDFKGYNDIDFKKPESFTNCPSKLLLKTFLTQI